MDSFLNYSYITDTETSQLKSRSRQIVSKLEQARSKLAPIIDDIILSASADLVQEGDNRFLGECRLSVEQCEDIIWASQIVKEIQYQSILDNRVYKWPNTDVIVNNVSVGYTSRADSSRGKTIVIDEATVVRLLEVYQQMGEVIQVFVNESNKQQQQEEEEVLTTASVISVRETHPSSRSIRNASERYPSTLSQNNRSRSRSRSQSPVSQTSHREMRASTTSFREDINPAQIKSTLSVLIKSSSRDLNKQSTTATSVKAIERQEEEPTHIYIKIQCCSDPSSDFEHHGGAHLRSVVIPANCDNQSTPHYHIRLGGEPVTLKVDQNNVEEGAVYCINTGTEGGEDDNIKIVIKQCPECFSTVIGSTTQIKDMLGESHESVTLHGKTVPDEADLSYSTDEVYSDKSKSKSRMQVESRILDDTDETVIEMDDSAVKVSKLASGSRVEIKSRSQVEPRFPTTSNLNIEPSRSKSRPLSQTGAASKSRTLSESRTISGSRAMSETKTPSGSRVMSGTKTPSGSRVMSATKTPSGSRIQISQPHIDVLIDTENVDRSSVQFNGEDEPENFEGVKSSLDAIHSRRSSYVTPVPSRRSSYVTPVPSRKRSAAIPLTRKRICSSMEFDVTTVQTRLRERDVEHPNPRIVVELTKMGVDQILRACRPAKCCRKAILDERQRTGLPYCVSLKSLPLMGNDVEVIKQSYDMSVKKIKNTINLSEVHRETLAYYIGLGKDDFRPNINFPWVVPIYDVKFNYRRPINKKHFYVLKPNDQDGEYKSHEGKSVPERYFILKKIISDSTTSIVSEPKIQKRKKRKVKRKRKVQYNETNKTISIRNNKNHLDTINKWNQSRGTFGGNYLPKSILDDIDQMFYKKQKEYFFAKWGDPLFSKLDLIGSYPKSFPDFSHIHDPLAHLRDLDFLTPYEGKNLIAKCEVPAARNLLKTGDCCFWSACKILDDVFEKFNIDMSFPASSNKTFSDTHFSSLEKHRQLSMGSFSTIWKHVSENLFYTSSDVTIFLKRRQSMGKIQKTVHTPIINTIEDQTDKYHEETLIESPKNKLEYYVTLVDGDLVWGNSLPLVSQNYNTYFNHDNITNGEDTPKPPTPVLGRPQQNSESVNILEPPAESVSGSSVAMEADKPNEKAEPIKTITKPEDKHFDEPVPISPTPTPTRQSFESESPDHPWAPFLISETSLPVVQEAPQKVEKVVQVEAPKPPKKEPVPEPPAGCNSSSCKKMKKQSCGQGVVIDIRKSTSKGATFIDTRATGGKCNKEICELYKNKLLIPDKTPPKASKAESQANTKQFTVVGKNNIKIVIDSKNVSVTKQQCKRSNENKCAHKC